MNCIQISFISDLNTQLNLQTATYQKYLKYSKQGKCTWRSFWISRKHSKLSIMTLCHPYLIYLTFLSGKIGNNRLSLIMLNHDLVKVGWVFINDQCLDMCCLAYIINDIFECCKGTGLPMCTADTVHFVAAKTHQSNRLFGQDGTLAGHLLPIVGCKKKCHYVFLNQKAPNYRHFSSESKRGRT